MHEPLEPSHVAALIGVTELRLPALGLTGPARALAYRLGVELGLSALEVAGIAAEHLRLGERPMLVLAASNDVLPLRRATADDLRRIGAFAPEAVLLELLPLDWRAAAVPEPAAWERLVATHLAEVERALDALRRLT